MSAQCPHGEGTGMMEDKSSGKTLMKELEDARRRIASLEESLLEHQKMLKALQEIEEVYRYHFSYTRDVLYFYDDQFRIQSVSPNVENILGYKPEELIGRCFQDLSLLDNADLGKAVDNALTVLSGKTVMFSTYTFIAKNGTRLFGEVSGIPLMHDGRVAGVISVARDITDRIKAEEEKKRLENDLVQAHKMDALGRFAGGIAHDLNNILYPIIIDSEWLLGEMEPGTPVHEVMEQVLTAAYRQRDLVRQILFFSRQNGQKTVAIKISDLVKETISFVRSMLPSTIEIRQHIDAGADTILGDPTQIQQVVMNLMKNAADSILSQRGAIDVTLEKAYLDPASRHSEMKAGPYVRFAVKDAGCGMAPDIMDRIFEPFFTTKAEGKGCGMGLSVVHGVLKSHGGTITAESEPGKGSLFTVFLPVYDGRSPKEEPSGEKHPPMKGMGRILVIDDEEIILSSIRRTLENSGYHVIALKDAMEALEVFAKNPDGFDLVITDLTMPGMTGIELSKKLLSLRSDLPVILSTGYSDAIDEREMKSLGIREMIVKPSNIVELKTAVRRVLEN